MKSVIADVNDPARNPFGAFRSLSNKNHILRNTLGMKYKLLTLVVNGVSVDFY